MATPDWNKLATTLQGLGVPKSLPTPPPAPTVQKGYMQTPPAPGMDYSATQGWYKTTNPALTDAQMNVKADLYPTAEQQIKREQDLQQMLSYKYQPQIDAINTIYAKRYEEERAKALQREGQNRAMLSRAGLLGTPQATTRTTETEDINKRQRELTDAEKALKIQEVYGKMNEDAKKRVEEERANALGMADKAMALRKERMNDATSRLKSLGQAGFDMEKIKSDANLYKYLQEATGMSDLEMDANLKIAQGDNIVKSGMEKVGNKLIGWTMDKNGNFKQTEYQSDIAPEEEYKEIDGVPYGMSRDAQGNLIMRPITGYMESPDKALVRAKTQADIANIYSQIGERNKNNVVSSEQSTYAKDSLDNAMSAIEGAEKFSQFAGVPDIATKTWRDIVGSEDFTNLEAYSDSLRTALLTLKTDPAVKKFFGPQMSNADVRMMMSAPTSLDPARQSPAQFKKELARVKKGLEALQKGSQIQSQPQQMTLNGKVLNLQPDGTYK